MANEGVKAVTHSKGCKCNYCDAKRDGRKEVFEFVKNYIQSRINKMVKVDILDLLTEIEKELKK